MIFLEFFGRSPAEIAEDIFSLKGLKAAALGFVKFFFGLGTLVGVIIAPIVNFFLDVGKIIGAIIIKSVQLLFNFGVKIGEALAKSIKLIGNIGQRVWDIIKSGFEFIKNALRNAANGILGFVNRLIPGRRFDVPLLAAGGIVTRPTLAVVGERGPEAVIPLNQAGGFGEITININNPSVRSEQDIKKIADAVSRVMAQKKLRGFAPNF